MNNEIAKPIALCGLMPQEITNVLSLEKDFRGLQIFKWIALGIDSFDKMSNLSKQLREKLSDEAIICSAQILQKHEDSDGTIKLQIQLHDGYIVETVLLIDADGRKTACVSSQVGCPIKCAFCRTGALGFARNLTTEEIVGQFLYLESVVGKLDNIVFMGMGEPLLNLPAIRHAIEILTNPEGRNLSKRRITLSTSGIIKGIYELADNGPDIRLALSLTCASLELRTQLMPITITNPLDELRKAIEYFIEKTNKRCTLEIVLLSNLTTTKQCAQELIDFTKNLNVHINLIPWNPVKELAFTEPLGTEVKTFMNYLEKAGLNVTIRTHRGRKIGGACGQLGVVSL